jgi:hypothetical protein
VVFARGVPGADGAMRFTRSGNDRDNAATYPVLAAAGDSILAAWTSGDAAGSVIHVEQLRFSDR